MNTSQATVSTTLDISEELSRYYRLDDGDDLTLNGIPAFLQFSNNRIPSITGRSDTRSKRLFSPTEKSAISMGVSMFGEGKWASIKKAFPEELSTRTTVNIKDCYRNMKNKKDKQQLFSQRLNNHNAVCHCCGATALPVTNNEGQTFLPTNPPTRLVGCPGLDATPRSESDDKRWKLSTSDSTTTDSTPFPKEDAHSVILQMIPSSSRRTVAKTSKAPKRPARRTVAKTPKAPKRPARRNAKRYKSSSVYLSSSDSSTSSDSTATSVKFVRRKLIPKIKCWSDDSSFSDDA
jgi:hypothetical protein